MAVRVVQWTTGGVGRAAVKAVLAHPDLELVGCYAWSEDKAGTDVGVLCGIDPIGVTATASIEDVLELRPDVVLYMPLHWEVDHMVRLLEAGINVVSTSNFITGRSYGEDEQRRLDEAAKRGGVSLHGSGVNPGLANALGLFSTAVCRRVDRVHVLESVDATSYASPQTWHELGFAGPPDAPGLADKVKQRSLVFVDAVEMMADALQVPLDDIVFSAEFGVATEDLDLGYMEIPKGTVCGYKGMWSGISGGTAVIELGLMWRLGYAMEPDWKAEGGYVVEVDGLPSVRTTMNVDLSGGGDVDFGMSTANPAVNSIHAVVAAPPGLVTVDQLPLITAAGLVGPRRA